MREIDFGEIDCPPGVTPAPSPRVARRRRPTSAGNSFLGDLIYGLVLDGSPAACAIAACRSRRLRTARSSTRGLPEGRRTERTCRDQDGKAARFARVS